MNVMKILTSLQQALQKVWTIPLIVSMLVAPFVLILLNLIVVVLLMVLSLKSLSLRFGILIEVLFLVLDKVSRVTL